MGDNASEMGDNLGAINLGTGRTVLEVSTGGSFTCARLDNSTVKCWGFGWNGEIASGASNKLGDGAGEMGDNLNIVDLGTGRTVTSLSTGSSHGCVILDNNGVKCWGLNTYGRLGQGDTTSRGANPSGMGDNLNEIDL